MKHVDWLPVDPQEFPWKRLLFWVGWSTLIYCLGKWHGIQTIIKTIGDIGG